MKIVFHEKYYNSEYAWDPAASAGRLEGIMDLIDSKERIRKNLLEALKIYGDRLMFIGPDCGLGGWQYPKVAYELLYRTYNVIQEVKNQFYIKNC